MPTLAADHYPVDIVMIGLRDVAQHVFRRELLFNAHTAFGIGIKRDLVYPMEIGCFIYEIQKCFGFQADAIEWCELFGLNPQNGMPLDKVQWVGPTFGMIAEFIARRAPVVSMDSLSVFGSPCASAGIFCGLQQIVTSICPSAARVAPTTPIWERLRGDSLRTFWTRVRWMPGGRLPLLELTPSRRKFNRTCAQLAISLIFLILILLAPWNWPQIPIWAVVLGIFTFGAIVGAGIFCFLMTLMYAIADNVFNPLPLRDCTFGDVARFLAGEDMARSSRRHARQIKFDSH